MIFVDLFWGQPQVVRDEELELDQLDKQEDVYLELEMDFYSGSMWKRWLTAAESNAGKSAAPQRSPLSTMNETMPCMLLLSRR